jgi:hypothetical protein
LRLSTKHANQQTITKYDFQGGLNSTTAQEMIADNQLYEVINMEPDSTTGLLRTVDGTEVLQKFNFDIFSAMWDKINKKFVVVSTETKAINDASSVFHDVYVSDLETCTRKGSLSGNALPIYALWEDGLLLASGGKLQYWNGTELVKIEASPDTCDGVYVRNGRVIVSTGGNNQLKYSGLGDENNWTENNNNDSSSKFLETGYKDGGNFIGMANLSDDIIFVKDNGYVYRLVGNYPNWAMKEISHEVDCNGRKSLCSLANNVMIFGKNKIQLIDTTQDYGDMKVTNIATNISNELAKLPNDAPMVYLPPINQVWIVGDKGKVLVYDCNYGSFFIRMFNTDVVDVFHAGDNVIVVKKNELTRLKSRSCIDAGLNLKWRFRAKRLVSQNEYLLKRVQVNITPYFDGYSNNTLTVGGITMTLPMPWSVYQVYNNFSTIYNNDAKVFGNYENVIKYAVGDKVYQNNELVYENDRMTYAVGNLSKNIRCVYRNKSIDIQASGNGGNFILNSINFDVVEV